MHLPFDKLLTFLHSIELFRDLDGGEIAALLPAMQSRFFEAGETLCREGDPAEGFFVIYSGRVHVHSPGTPNRRGVDIELGAEHCVCEMAMLEDSPRTATVVALEPTMTLYFPRRIFERLLREVTPGWKLVGALARAHGRRLRGEDPIAARAEHAPVI